RARPAGAPGRRPWSTARTRRSRADRKCVVTARRSAVSQERLAIRAAAALDQPVAVGVIVICQLFALSNAARRPDPDDAVLDLDVAVRPARMIDESGDVAADAGVDDGAVGQLEAPDVTALDVPALAAKALPVGDFFAGIVDDLRVLGNRLGGKHAPAVNSRTPFLNHLFKISLVGAPHIGPLGLECARHFPRSISCARSARLRSRPWPPP